MNNAQLEQGKIHQSNIEHLEKQIEKWEMSTGFKGLELETQNGGCIRNVDFNFIPFKAVMALTLTALKKRLQEEQTAFKNL